MRLLVIYSQTPGLLEYTNKSLIFEQTSTNEFGNLPNYMRPVYV